MAEQFSEWIWSRKSVIDLLHKGHDESVLLLLKLFLLFILKHSLSNKFSKKNINEMIKVNFKII